MKRILCLVLSLLISMSFLACGGEGKTSEWEGKFAVGYGREDVTPNYSVGMRGFGDVRMSIGVLHKLYITCVAVTDETGNTVLLFTYDCKNMKKAIMMPMAEAVSSATGVPVEKIFISCTHSHSTPDLVEPFLTFANERAVKAAEKALADRSAATVDYTSAIVENMSFVRHYNTSNGKVAGDNFNPSGAGTRVSHTTEADKEMRVIRVNREGKKPIVMVNWMGHASLGGTSQTDFGKENREYMSSDYVGACREYVESNMECDFALFMGASGNVNGFGTLAGEKKYTTTYAYGQALGDHIIASVEDMTAGTTGPATVATTQFESKYGPITVNAIGMGSIGIITGSFEMFDTTSMAIREKSPYDITFVLTLTNGSAGYMPTDICYDYENCYEVRQSGFSRGAAEQIVDVYADLLNQTKGN